MVCCNLKIFCFFKTLSDKLFKREKKIMLGDDPAIIRPSEEIFNTAFDRKLPYERNKPYQKIHDR